MWLNTYCLVLLDMFSLMFGIGLYRTFLISAYLKNNFSSSVSVRKHSQQQKSGLVRTKNLQSNSCDELAMLSFRSEVSKLQLPSSTRAEQQSTGSRLSQRCCLDSQHDRCSPTGRAVTTPDKSEISFDLIVQ